MYILIFLYLSLPPSINHTFLCLPVPSIPFKYLLIALVYPCTSSYLPVPHNLLYICRHVRFKYSVSFKYNWTEILLWLFAACSMSLLSLFAEPTHHKNWSLVPCALYRASHCGLCALFFFCMIITRFTGHAWSRKLTLQSIRVPH